MTYKDGAGRENYESGSIKDICQTPGYALEPLLPYLRSFRAIWEPACGEGILAEVLRERLLRVEATDISIGEGFNFFEYECTYYQAIVTNPPFADRISFMKRCVELGKPWALLMPTETVSLKSFIEIVMPLDPQLGIIWFSPRVNFKMPYKKWEGSSYFPVAWFTWNMGFEGNKFIYMDHWTKEYRERFEI